MPTLSSIAAKKGWAKGRRTRELIRERDMECKVRVNRLIEAAKEWAAYQEADSVADQKDDVRLRVNASAARDRLLAAIEALN
jgi:hypothetical protein